MPCLLLTRRAPGLRAHAGRWALPGSRRDAGETPVQAALRETAEEVGLTLPLADLDVAPRFISIPGSTAPVIQLPLLGGYLRAPTAAIVHQFCRIACHREVLRVTHYEQPVFAWR